jgi:dynein heavy chain
LLKTPLPYSDGESFTLVLLMDSNILEVKDDVEEICDSADKQLAIERKMVELKDMWSVCQFEFTMWKNRDVPVLKAFGYVIEELEEA